MTIWKDIKKSVNKSSKWVSGAAKSVYKGAKPVVNTVYKDVVKKPLATAEKSYENISGGLSKAISSPITLIVIGVVAIAVLSKK
jgi:hypothetical protein